MTTGTWLLGGARSKHNGVNPDQLISGRGEVFFKTFGHIDVTKGASVFIVTFTKDKQLGLHLSCTLDCIYTLHNLCINHNKFVLIFKKYLFKTPVMNKCLKENFTII